MKTRKNDHPMLMRAPMVLGTLNTKPGVWPPEPIDPAKPYKSVTRRVVRPQPTGHGLEWIEAPEGFAAWVDRGLNLDETSEDGGTSMRLCPYGQHGDRLWVKEWWRVGAWAEDDQEIAVDYKADGFARKEWIFVEDPDYFVRLWEQSTIDAEKALGLQDRYEWKPGTSPCRWRSSRFMPRRFSRLSLEIKSIKVEKLQDISEEEARLEGFAEELGALQARDGSIQTETSRRMAFIKTWDHLNCARGYTFGVNPWVWRIEFMRLI